VPVDQLAWVKTWYRNRKKGSVFVDPGLINIDGLLVLNFVWLLTRGADPNCKGEALKGWLEVPREHVQAVREFLVSFTDVYVAHHGPSPALDNDPGSDLSSSPDAIAKLTCETMLKMDDVPEAYKPPPATEPKRTSTRWGKKTHKE
jgi:hypothetical protein